MSKRVVWDEKNLTENEDYRRLHPVTMKIDEPKTPYCPEDAEEEGSFDDTTEDERDDTTWDPEVNAFVRKIKNEVPLLRDDPPPAAASATVPLAPSSTTSSAGKRAGVTLAPVTQDATEGEQEKRQHELEFRIMRRAVYADEGKHFKSAVESGNAVLDE